MVIACNVLFQMLLAYCQLLLSLAAVLSHLHVSSPVSGTTTGPPHLGVRQTARYDPDNESLGPPYDLRVIGNSNRDDGLSTSHPRDNGCHGATPPAQMPHSEAASNAMLTAEDLYQSNSI